MADESLTGGGGVMDKPGWGGGVMDKHCPACGAPVDPEHKYCERCGHNLRAGFGQIVSLSSTAAPSACTGCGSTQIGAEGYCEHCGQRRVAGQDRAELELPGVAGVTDRGRHRKHNEDALAIGRVNGVDPGLTVAVVCDGVSTSSRADAAAHAAVDAAIAALLDVLADSPQTESIARTAIESATRAAASVVAALGKVESGHNPPSCTYVTAVVTAHEVTVGWVGDSRAYWLADPPADSLALTADDSLAGQLATAGRPPGAGPGADPRALALLRWLGADATDTAPRLFTFTPAGPGRVLLCSDGLSRYLPQPADLATAASTVESLAAARRLTQLALDAGGQDNIAVALLPFPPPPDSPGGSIQ
jgi:serine/threonine protein phosphatase PrpC